MHGPRALYGSYALSETTLLLLHLHLILPSQSLFPSARISIAPSAVCRARLASSASVVVFVCLAFARLFTASLIHDTRIHFAHSPTTLNLSYRIRPSTLLVGPIPVSTWPVATNLLVLVAWPPIMSAFYDADANWPASARSASWEQREQQPSQQSQQQSSAPRSGATSSMSHHSDSNAFAAQFEEIERATDNLMKSGKWAPGAVHGMGAPGRRDTMPSSGRGFDYSNDPRMGGGPSRHHSVSEYTGERPGSAGLQGFYAGQRFPGGRQSEAEAMLQQKRRMAAQRERELRNYHQEQQYNRTAVSGPKSDRAMSPNTMSDDDRRELIARQHRALYGDNSSMYGSEGSTSRAPSQDVRSSTAGRGQSPLAFDPYGVQSPTGSESVVQMPPRDRTESTASPASNPTTQQSFAHLSDAQQSSRTSNSSPGGSPPLAQGQGQKTSVGGVGPIGSRPTQPPHALNKRATTPLTPSSLSYGFSNADAQKLNNNNAAKDERTTAASSNSGLTAEKNVPGLAGWGSNSGVWGSSKNTLAVQPSVWG
ncbi:Hypothetical protein R9X50_00572400 [Acrodontium crateriforme]|uniref:Uncharacterized protein n=1 Tax=Acrodontium crateriforme TaxID=150365 RepID=A0AAQ3R672_9PEZI|nr:Hypothetical protein R9X50_00572400 [Acrodontium crateriforme]